MEIIVSCVLVTEGHICLVFSTLGFCCHGYKYWFNQPDAANSVNKQNNCCSYLVSVPQIRLYLIYLPFSLQLLVFPITIVHRSVGVLIDLGPTILDFSTLNLKFFFSSFPLFSCLSRGARLTSVYIGNWGNTNPNEPVSGRSNKVHYKKLNSRLHWKLFF